MTAPAALAPERVGAATRATYAAFIASGFAFANWAARIPQVRDQLDGLGATQTRIVVSGDLDEFAIAGLRAEPVDSYGIGTSLVTGSGAPTANMVYKLVEVDGIPVEKRSVRKEPVIQLNGQGAAQPLARDV